MNYEKFMNFLKNQRFIDPHVTICLTVPALKHGIVWGPQQQSAIVLTHSPPDIDPKILGGCKVAVTP